MNEAELESKFSAFYEAINGFTPYNWQIRLMKRVAKSGQWPDRINAPTGAGKTAVIEVHVFLNALVGNGELSIVLPRRLCLTVNRRALVDSQYEHACEVGCALGNSIDVIRETSGVNGDEKGILAEIAQGLLRRQGSTSLEDDLSIQPLHVAQIRGGMGSGGLDRTWRLYPEAPMVLCATPDMFGSRLLFRGYGASAYARPWEAGLLAYDTVLVADEAHLNRQLVFTARRVSVLENGSKLAGGDAKIRPLQVVESTATPPREVFPFDTGALSEISVEKSDLESNSELKRRLGRPKVIERVGDQKKGIESNKLADCIVTSCQELSEQRGGTVAAIVNTVSLALEVAARLEKAKGKENVVCVVGRMRPFNRDVAIRRLKQLNVKGDGTFIVGTQALEAGVDYDCHSLVTELAPGDSLVQRLGRLNRFGKFEDGKAVVVTASSPKGPYDPEDLKAASDWIDGCLPKNGVNSQWLAKNGAPSQKSKRMLFQRLEAQDVEFFTHTSEMMGAETGSQNGCRADLDLWLRDELGREKEHDVSLVVRSDLPKDGFLAANLLTRIPPLVEEEFPCAIWRMRKVIEACLSEESEFDAESRSRVFYAEDGQHFEWLAGLNAAKETLKPGGTYVLDADKAQIFKSGVVCYDKLESKDEKKKFSLVGELEIVDDVYAKLVAGRIQDGDTSYPFVLDKAMVELAVDNDESAALACAVVDTFEEEALSKASDDEALEEIRDWNMVRLDLKTHFNDVLSQGEPLLATLDDFEVLLDRDEGDEIIGIYIVCCQNVMDDTETGIEINAASPVLLQDHEEAVARNVRRLAKSIGLDEGISKVLGEAGSLHDEGKVDSRFQEMLHEGIEDSTGILAKSMSRGRVFDRQLYRRLGLRGWRHEQLSAAITWNKQEKSESRKIVTRLVGTSHGRGRDTFSWYGSNLTDDDDLERYRKFVISSTVLECRFVLPD